MLQNWQFEGNIWPAKPEHLPQVFCWTQPATQQGRHAVVMLAMAIPLLWQFVILFP